MPRVCSLTRAWTVTTSEPASRVSRSTSSTPRARARAASAKGSWARTVAPKAAKRVATRCPTAPSPTMPTVQADSSGPHRSKRKDEASHSPAAISCPALPMLRVKAMVAPTVNSATASRLRPGRKATGSRRRLAAARSMLTGPPRTLPTRRTLGAAASRTAAVSGARWVSTRSHPTTAAATSAGSPAASRTPSTSPKGVSGQADSNGTTSMLPRCRRAASPRVDAPMNASPAQRTLRSRVASLLTVCSRCSEGMLDRW